MLIPLKLYGFLSNVYDSLVDVKNDNEGKVKTAIDYIVNNPDKVILGIGTVASLLRASQSLVVSHRNYAARKYAERSYYDSHSHTKWMLRRQLTNYEKKSLNQRISDGEKAVDILEEMGVLK